MSVIVVAYEMARELPRTIASLLPPIQRSLDDLDYEVIVVDNGSTPPLRLDFDPRYVRALRIDHASKSPASAVNAGLALAQHDLIGVFIDGARISSPGVICHAVMASRLHERPVIATPAFHLGPEIQTSSVRKGYNSAREDELLASVTWQEDAYRLFDISAFGGSSAGGWFSPLAESNALFMTRAMWDELGGYDEAFRSPGGGLVNLDTYARACHLPGAQVIVLLGEATFHQVHGGVATNAVESPFQAFHEEYIRLRGSAFQPPDPDRIYLGRIHPAVLRSLRESVNAKAW